MSVKAKSEGYLLEDLADGMKPDEWVCLQAYHFSLPIMPPKASTQGPELSLDFQRKRLLHIREERTRGSRRSMFKELIFTLSGFVEGGRKNFHTQYYTYLAVHSVNILHPLIFLYCITNRERSPEAYRQHRSFTFSSRVTWTLAMCLLNKDISFTKNEKQ